MNTVVILANDAKAELHKSVMVNPHRLGVTNPIISYYDGHQFPKVVGVFDRVLHVMVQKSISKTL